MKLNLDDVPWDTLEHAYGSATDVPEQLSLLMSPDKAVYEEALGHFWGNIIHQGTVYEATSYVVPFLIALLESPEVACRAEIMALLSGIAGGSSYHVAHRDMDKAMGTADVGSLEWQQIAQKELGGVGAAYLAAESGIPVYLNLLKNDLSTNVRAAATYILGSFPGRRDEIIPLLLQELSAESAAEVQASRLLAATHLAQTNLSENETEDHAPTLAVVNAANALLTAPDVPTLVRIAASLTLARLSGPKTPEAAVSVLLESLRNPEAVNDAFLSIPWSGDRSIVSTVSSVLVRSGSVPTQTLLPILLEIMPKGTDWKTCFEASSITHSILNLCRFEVKNPNPYVPDRLPGVPSELTPLQRETLLRLCDTFDTWEVVDGDLVLRLRLYGFPDPRKMRGFLMSAD